MVTTQSAVTVMAEILPGHETALRQLLEDAGRDPANNALVPFGQFTNVHFARFFVIDGVTDLAGRPLAPRLAFLADVDGPADAFLVNLTSLAADGLSTIFAHCRNYPGKTGTLDFLRSRSVPTSANYVNTLGRTVQQVRQEAFLRESIQDFLDRTHDQYRTATARNA